MNIRVLRCVCRTVPTPQSSNKSAMEASSRGRIKEETVDRAIKALLKWKLKNNRSNSHSSDEGDGDDFMYLAVTLEKVPPKELTRNPHRISLKHTLLSHDDSSLNLCLIVDGKRITSEGANKLLKNLPFAFNTQVIKLSKLKSDYASFDSKKRLYDSFDVFLAAKSVVSLLPKVLGRVFYKKKRKIPIPLELKPDGSNWKEEIGKALKSNLWCLSSGTCSVLRVGKWGVMDGKSIADNVFEAIDEVVKIVPKKWRGVKCLHLKFSDSLALPIYGYGDDDSNVDEEK